MNTSPRCTLTVRTCLALAISPALLPGAEPTVVQTPDVAVEYGVNSEAEPLSLVRLWYSADHGVSWTESGTDDDRRSPAMFHAPGDGEYGLFIVLENATGPSSQPPTTGTEPHVAVVVDQTPPVVQLHALRRTVSFGKPVVQVRWTAIDALFPSRPIELQYRESSGSDWRAITPEPIANTGRYEWTPPDGLMGVVNIRIDARDRGGHVAQSDAQSVELVPALAVGAPSSVASREFALGDVGSARPVAATIDPAVSGSPRARDRAARLITEAGARRDSSDVSGAIARLRDAVRLDPSRTDAFAEMARLFYGLGEWDRALGAYDIVLQQQPRSREALLGAAGALTQRKDYSAASEKLRTILRFNPGDAEVWMNLGDVAIYGGDEVLARDCYLRASEIDPAATRVVEDAQKRLKLMDDVSRRYGDR